MEHDDDLTGAETAAPAHGGYKIPALRALSEITTSLSSDSDLEDQEYARHGYEIT